MHQPIISTYVGLLLSATLEIFFMKFKSKYNSFSNIEVSLKLLLAI